MDARSKKDTLNKRESSGFVSKALFLWMIPLLWKGRKRVIEIEDINDVPEKNKSDTVSEQLQRYVNLQYGTQ
jgi:hypothetical protein